MVKSMLNCMNCDNPSESCKNMYSPLNFINQSHICLVRTVDDLVKNSKCGHKMRDKFKAKFTPLCVTYVGI